MFIDSEYIKSLLENGKGADASDIDKILDKAENFEGLTPQEVASVLTAEEPTQVARIFEIAGKIKEHIYGNRIVMFAPIYVSDYCVNNCDYCGFACSHEHGRKKLSPEEIRAEVKILEKMGHKRLALEAGEDPKNCDIDYILECMRTIYDMKFDNGEIRRINVNIAATTVENYKKLKDVGIGTYILFQETYNRESYEKHHISGPKSNFEYHLTAFDRAMEAGIDDVGGGVLFGLYDAYFEVLGLMLHNAHLEERFGVGFHTISVPRLCKTEGMELADYPNILTDDEFLKICAVIRLAVPFTGMIISTRESKEMRKKLIKIGISQVSAGSSVEVGGYSQRETGDSQFEVADNREAIDIISWLMDEGLIPSFCTACYRSGRTGDRFMELAKSGNIKNVCLPNALMTLCEYAYDYGDESFRAKASTVIANEVDNIQSDKIKEYARESIKKIRDGERDFYV